jgi:hypothetical protein
MRLFCAEQVVRWDSSRLWVWKSTQQGKDWNVDSWQWVAVLVWPEAAEAEADRLDEVRGYDG